MMTPELKQEMGDFFKVFWSDPANVEEFKKQRAKSAFGNCDRLGRSFITRDEMEGWARELGMPVLEFSTSNE